MPDNYRYVIPFEAKKEYELTYEYQYYFKFLSPVSYDLFFQDLREGKYQTFRSRIEAELEDIGRAKA